jgi:peroxiredoxin
LPSLERLRNTLAGSPFEILAIDVGESKAVVEDFIRAGGYTLPVLLDIDGKVSSLYNVRSHPKTLIIDPSGRVIGIASGYREWDSKAMLTLFEKLLNEDQSS